MGQKTYCTNDRVTRGFKELPREDEFVQDLGKEWRLGSRDSNRLALTHSVRDLEIKNSVGAGLGHRNSRQKGETRTHMSSSVT